MNDLRSLIPPSISHSSQKALKLGDTVPDAPKLDSDKPSIVCFLRHIGCPFAEKTFRDLHAFAEIHREQYQYIAISHGTERDTKDWIEEVGGTGRITVLSDEQFQMYQAWGVGTSGWTHYFGWSSLSSVWTLAREEGIKNRLTRGNRWISAATFGVKDGKIIWIHLPQHAGDIPKFEEMEQTIKKNIRESKL